MNSLSIARYAESRQILRQLIFSRLKFGCNTNTQPQTVTVRSYQSSIKSGSTLRFNSLQKISDESGSRLFCQRCQHLELQQRISRRYYSPIVDEGAATHKPTPLQQRMLVWEKFYPSLDKVPDRVSKGQMKKAMDKFRVRCSLYMIALTLICAAIMATIGRMERDQGNSVAKINQSRYSKT
ncbi:protein FAM162A [Biomphalaria pfeifferi]|uniref:Protein FAM162A n=1 Tax=Biomphalaria pfeifferi TaxID=112525 RepID=A0AAD8BNE6_BIOPF|nr:protein FAM162A [Biomphalaria pfeifferi]